MHLLLQNSLVTCLYDCYCFANIRISANVIWTDWTGIKCNQDGARKCVFHVFKTFVDRLIIIKPLIALWKVLWDKMIAKDLCLISQEVACNFGKIDRSCWKCVIFKNSCMLILLSRTGRINDARFHLFNANCMLPMCTAIKIMQYFTFTFVYLRHHKHILKLLANIITIPFSIFLFIPTVYSEMFICRLG